MRPAQQLVRRSRREQRRPEEESSAQKEMTVYDSGDRRARSHWRPASTSWPSLRSGGTIDVPDVVGLERAPAEDAIRAARPEAGAGCRGVQRDCPGRQGDPPEPGKGRQTQRGRHRQDRGQQGQQQGGGSGPNRPDGRLRGFQAAGRPASTPTASRTSFRTRCRKEASSARIPAAGTQVQKGSSVKYVVSKGAQPPKEVKVPDVRNLTVDQASSAPFAGRADAGNYHGGVSRTQWAPARSSARARVRVQKAKEGSSVNIVVSKGPQPVKVTVPIGHHDDQDRCAERADWPRGWFRSSAKLSNPDPATHGVMSTIRIRLPAPRSMRAPPSSSTLAKPS